MQVSSVPTTHFPGRVHATQDYVHMSVHVPNSFNMKRTPPIELDARICRRKLLLRAMKRAQTQAGVARLELKEALSRGSWVAAHVFSSIAQLNLGADDNILEHLKQSAHHGALLHQTHVFNALKRNKMYDDLVELAEGYAHKGNLVALLDLVLLLFRGDGDAFDGDQIRAAKLVKRYFPPHAIRTFFFPRAAEYRDFLMVAWDVYTNHGPMRDAQLALDILIELDKIRHPPAMAHYGFYQMCSGESETNIVRDIAAGFARIQAAAEAGDAKGMCYLSMAYRDGRGCDKNLHAALHWCKSAAADGVRSALEDLACMYEEGSPPLKNPSLVDAYTCRMQLVLRQRTFASKMQAALQLIAQIKSKHPKRPDLLRMVLQGLKGLSKKIKDEDAVVQLYEAYKRTCLWASMRELLDEAMSVGNRAAHRLYAHHCLHGLKPARITKDLNQAIHHFRASEARDADTRYFVAWAQEQNGEDEAAWVPEYRKLATEKHQPAMLRLCVYLVRHGEMSEAYDMVQELELAGSKQAARLQQLFRSNLMPSASDVEAVIEGKNPLAAENAATEPRPPPGPNDHSSWPKSPDPLLVNYG